MDASSVEHDMFTAAASEEKLWAFIGFLDGRHVEKNSGSTQLDQRRLFCCETVEVEQKERN